MKDCYVVLEPVIENIDAYKQMILSNEFATWDFGYGQSFHNIAKLEPTLFSTYLEGFLPAYTEVAHFARKSPEGQLEPNYIHSDEAHADLTALLFLSDHPDCGTRLYSDDGKPIVTIHMNKGTGFVFSSSVKHSRLLENNFGDGDEARLVEVVFLKQIE
jgi:hypothetical protein